MSNMTGMGIDKMWERTYRVMCKASLDGNIYLEQLVQTLVQIVQMVEYLGHTKIMPDHFSCLTIHKYSKIISRLFIPIELAVIL